MLGLPSQITACLFDMDGVLTQTTPLHTKAWAETFDAYLRERAERSGTAYVPFDTVSDYAAYVDGKPRYDGVRDFLASRNIVLPEGTPDDPPTAETVCGVGNRKNVLVQQIIRTDGAQTYPGSVRYLHEVKAAGLATAVVSSSANTTEILASAGLSDMFDAQVDGLIRRSLSLPGKPAPDTFLHAAQLLGVPPERAAVFEDALAGVAAGRAGHFGLVVGVDRLDQADALRSHGADIVVEDLADLLPEHPGAQQAAQEMRS